MDWNPLESFDRGGILPRMLSETIVVSGQYLNLVFGTQNRSAHQWKCNAGATLGLRNGWNYMEDLRHCPQRSGVRWECRSSAYRPVHRGVLWQ